MRTNKLLPGKRSLLVTLFVVMAIGFSTAAYAQQKSITISGIPNNYRGKVAMLVLAPSVNNQNYTAYSLAAIGGASVTFSLLDWKTDGPWNGSGNFAFSIMVGENTQAIAGSQFLYIGQTAATASVAQTTTTVQWSQFISSTAQQPAQQGGGQKSITISGIPNNYRGKVAMLSMAPSTNSQTYTAYSLATISGASVTFALSDFTTDNPWSGSGNFAFIIIIGENAQAIASKQYLYVGQTAATASVTQTTTTVQWSQFISSTQQAAQQPAAPAGNTYVITGSGTSFSAAKGGTAVGTGSIESVIAAIKTNANGADITVQFGDGTNVLDIGKGNNTPLTGTVIFNGSGWGTITVTGKITANRSGYPNGSTVEFDGVSGIINADITNTNSSWHAVTKKGKTGTLTVNGGTIIGGNTGVGATDTSEVIVNGGTITGFIGIDLGLDAKATVNGGTITGTGNAGVYLTNNSNMLTVTGGTVKGTGNATGIYCMQGGTVILSGSNTLITSSAVPGANKDKATISLSNGGDSGSPSQRATLVIGKGVRLENTVPTGVLIFNRQSKSGTATVTDNR